MEKTDKFLKCMKIVFAHEGGYSNDKDDAGGKTNFGITEATLKVANKRGITKITDVRNLTRDICEDIYVDMYWNMSKCKTYVFPLDLIVFDTAINCGTSRAIQFLQEAINMLYDYKVLVVDGIYGKQTKKYVDSSTDTSNKIKILCNIYLDVRTNYYQLISKKRPANKKFLKGWLNRVASLRKHVSEGVK